MTDQNINTAIRAFYVFDPPLDLDLNCDFCKELYPHHQLESLLSSDEIKAYDLILDDITGWNPRSARPRQLSEAFLRTKQLWDEAEILN